MTTRESVVLLSGGLDSSTCLAIARAQGFACHALAFRYHQRHAVELEFARAMADAHGALSFRVVDVDLAQFGGSALTADIAVPKARDVQAMSSTVPITYVPARNTVFLSFALALCEVTRARDVFIGANALDYSGYPDCRPAYLRAFEAMANLATKAGTSGETLRIHAPLLTMTKAQIAQEGTRLGVDLAQTWSCYDPQRDARLPHGVGACGACDSCLLRKKGFQEAGLADPTHYASAG